MLALLPTLALGVLLQAPAPAPAVSATPPGPVVDPRAQGVVLGPEDPRDLAPMAVLNSQASAAARAVSPAFETSRSGRDFTYSIPLPPGEYRLRIGYYEDLYFRPGCRVFTVLGNGAPLARNVDLNVASGLLLENGDSDGDGRMSLTERRALGDYWVQETQSGEERRPGELRPVVVGDEGRLDLRFVAAREIKETVPVSWIVIEGEGFRREIDCGGDDDLPMWFEQDAVGQALVARFGARAFLDLRTQFGQLHESPLGIFSEAAKPDAEQVIKPVSALIGFQLPDRQRYVLPLVRDMGADVHPFDRVRQRRTLTRVVFEVEGPGFAGTITFTAPFHPTDARIATAPYFDVSFRAARTRPDGPDTLKALFFLPAVETQHREIAKDLPIAGSVIRTAVDGKNVERGLFLDVRTMRHQFGRIVRKHNGLIATVDLSLEQGESTGSMVYAAHVAQPVLTVEGEAHRFYYTRHFPAVEDVARYALAMRDEGLAAADAVDALVEDAILPEGLKDALRFAFPSFLANTVMTIGPDQRWWYSCMEGYCRYHATVDVEYNAAPFYLWFAPDLLRHLLEAWPRYLKDAPEPLEGHRFLSHDIGIDDRIAGQEYQHDMPVEENTNYVLMLHAYWTATGDDEFVRGRRDVVRELLQYVLASDLDGDGFPEVGTANTIDDAPAAIQFSREQTYLAVKAAAAFLAGAEIMESGDGRGAIADDAPASWRRQARRIVETLDAEAWLGTHYAVCLDRTTEGLDNPWDNLQEHTNVPRQSVAPLPAGPLAGWDEPHPYTTLGLLYLLRAGVDTGFDEGRLLADLRTAAEACERRFADAHTASGRNGWISLNLFRDAVQSYLGDDVLDRSARYAALQGYRARAPDDRERAGFCDSMYNRYLSYYPRGVAAFALVDAAAGLRIDRRRGTVSLRPVRAPLRVPLTAFATWDPLDYRVPWFEVARDEESGAVSYTLSGLGLMEEMDITVDLSLLGGAVEKVGE